MPSQRERCPVCQYDYTWSWYHIWTIRTLVLKMASIALLLALGLNFVALFTDQWLVTLDSATGLFDHVIKGTGVRRMNVPLVCPILAVLATIILLCANILNIFFVTKRFQVAMPAVIVFSFIGALMMMTVIVTWSVPHVAMSQRLSWSFIVATVAVVVEMAGCGLCVMEFLTRSGASLRFRRTPNNSQPPVSDSQVGLRTDIEDDGGGEEEVEFQEL